MALVYLVHDPGSNKYLRETRRNEYSWVERNRASAYLIFEEARDVAATCGLPAARVEQASPLRDHGMADSTPYVKNAPRVVGPSDIGRPCPNCGCTTLYDIAVDVEMPLLRSVGGKGVGHYIGCPACPFASPMMMVADGETARR